MNSPNDPKTPDPTNAAWEDAMTRDFDARVRDLHEAPLDFDSVKGKARTIRRNRRAAVAGGILGVAAIVTPFAVLASNNGNDDSKEPPVVDDPTETIADPTAGLDYVVGRTWHQSDGDEVMLPKGDYYQAGVWDGQLVTLQPWGEVYSKLSIFDENGGQPEELENIVGFAISADGTILSYSNADGQLIARWDDGQSVLAEDVTDSGGGESVGGDPVSVVGTAPCVAESGACLVRINTDTGGCRGIGSSDVALPDDAVKCYDEQDGLLTYTNEVHNDGVTCGGVWSSDTFDFLWSDCVHQAQDISPSGDYVVGAPSVYDGSGYKEISILDARTGDVVAAYTVDADAAFIRSDVSWTTSGDLLFSSYDGADWHLNSMAPDGTVTELLDPVAGDEFDSPFLLIRH